MIKIENKPNTKLIVLWLFFYNNIVKPMCIVIILLEKMKDIMTTQNTV